MVSSGFPRVQSLHGAYLVLTWRRVQSCSKLRVEKSRCRQTVRKVIKFEISELAIFHRTSSTKNVFHRVDFVCVREQFVSVWNSDVFVRVVCLEQ